MMRTLGTLLLIVLLVPSIAPYSVMAQQTATVEEESATAATTEQPLASFFAETTVTATGSERNVFDIATPVTVIREEKIAQKSVENVADLLREQPGVDVNGVGPNQARPVTAASADCACSFSRTGFA